MNLKHLKKFNESWEAENQKIIDDSYNDYITLDDEHEKEIMSRHIARTAKGFISNRDSKLEDWLEKFKDEDIVLSKLKNLS